MSSESTEESDDIMCATYRALCRHGYADLTMQDIADEWNKSKAALHYHYDTKQGLLLSFLDYLFDQYRRRVADPSGDDARERLLSFLDASLAPSDRDASREFQTAALEIKAQAPYEGAFRDRLVELDEFVRRRVRELVAAGVEDGSIRGTSTPPPPRRPSSRSSTAHTPAGSRSARPSTRCASRSTSTSRID
ncbi:TetR/AcrR family transcriptional regulator [Haloplanus sp. GCM10025708]|uniref:TetR/AcrR family transcriptional regulator n=1 Tax=Haloplanus sp. GCM10025708 TaxID=3252679 RepID=UPI0036213BA0